jgi:PAS domain S-box-containing protein
MNQKPSYAELEKRVRDLEQALLEHKKTPDLENEQKRLTEAFHEREEIFHLFMEHSPVYIFFKDEKIRSLYLSRNYEKMLGLPLDQLIGKTMDDLFPSDLAKSMIADDQAILREGKVKYIEETFNGRFYETIKFPIRINGRPSYLAGFTLDITDRKQAEKALIESEQKWRNILVNTPQIGIALDPEAKIIFANDHFLKLTGWERREILGKDWFNLFIPEAIREDIRNIFHVVMNRKDASGFSNYENEILTKKTELLNVAWSNVLTRDARGKVLDVTCFGIDLTERKRAEEKLKESEEKYRFMMESFTDPLYICSPDFRIEYMNPAMIRRIGRDATHENCHSALHGMDHPCGWCDFEAVGAGKTMEINLKSPFDDRHYRVTHMPVHHKDGTVSKMALFRDITEYLKAVVEKEKAQAQLIQSQKMESIGTLAGGIAHEFNNMLSIIMGNTELAMDELPEWNPARTSLEEIRVAGLRARDMVKQLLTFSRKDDAKKTALDMGAVVKESLRLIRSSIPANIDIHQNISKTPAVVLGNITQINQVLINLCSNAADAMMQTGGSLGIDLDTLVLAEDSPYAGLAPGSYVKLVVSDTGSGMDKDTLNRVFEPYFTTKGIGKGTGIGLAVVHGIVERHQGLIRVESTLGKGSVFTLLFPAFQGRIEPAKEEQNNLPKGRERILFVDDEPVLMKLGKQRLEMLGYTVQGATDPLRALEIFKADPGAFDLLITDMAMPGMTGDQLAVEMFRIRPKLPAMLCTGYSETLSEQKAYDIGFSSFVMKPVDRTELALAVRKILDGVEK